MTGQSGRNASAAPSWGRFSISEEAEAKWHSLSPEEVLRRQQVAPGSGLRSAEVPARQKQYGYNLFGEIRPRSRVRLFLQQFQSIVVLLLIAASAISAILGEYLDAVAIAVALLLSAALGFVTEARAETALLALKRLAVPTARVRRDHQEQEIAASDLVPGDVVILTPGSRGPADGRLLESSGLLVEEAALTGESTPSAKDVGVVRPDAPLAERTNMVYLGTTVVSGSGLIVVTATGQSTEIGRIGRLVASIPREETPLAKAVEELGRRLLVVLLAVSFAVIGIGLLHREPVGLMLRTGISLAIAAVPEGLPAVTTVALALGLRRMVRRHSIVRRLSSVETLGCTTVICADKTGTLTTNTMTVRELWLPTVRSISVTGAGYEPIGDFATGDLKLDPLDNTQLLAALRVGVLCNNATLEHDPMAGWHIHGDPTEAALVVLGKKGGMDRERLTEEFPRVYEETFDERRKRMATFHRTPDGNVLICVKGATQVVLPQCGLQMVNDGTVSFETADRERALRQNEDLAAHGLRVLCLANRLVPDPPPPEAAQRDLVFIGLIAIADPPRVDVAEAIAQCKRAGIRVVMITGDQKLTALAVARELGMLDTGEATALEPRDLLGLETASETAVLRRVNVFARVSPEDKLSIVRAFQRSNADVVAMTGDGVNDALALKAADIGIALGQRAADVAKEAADIVITDERFSTIVTAVREGRVIYDNIRRAIRFLLTASFSTILAILIGIVFEVGLPLLPLQILWLNLVVHVFPALALTLERGESGLMERPPRPPAESILTLRLLGSILWRSILIAGAAMMAYATTKLSPETSAASSTVAFAAISLALLLHMFNLRSDRSLFRGEFPLLNRYLLLTFALTLALQLSGVYAPFMQNVLRTSPLNLLDWAEIVMWSIFPFMITELIKLRSERKASGPHCR